MSLTSQVADVLCLHYNIYRPNVKGILNKIPKKPKKLSSTFFDFFPFFLLTIDPAGGARLAGFSTPILAKSTFVQRGRILSALFAALGADVATV